MPPHPRLLCRPPAAGSLSLFRPLLQLGERGEFAKYSPCEVAAHVPLIVRAPGGAPAVTQSLVELVDLWPSLADIAGLPAPPLCSAGKSKSTDTCVEGASFAGHVHGSHSAPRAQAHKAAVFNQYSRPADSPRRPTDGNTDLPSLANITVMGYSIRTDDDMRYTEWVGFTGRYTQQPQGGGKIVTSGPQWADVHARELYLLAADPMELANKADDPEHKDLVASLSARLRQGWRAALPAAAAAEGGSVASTP
jgi:iduronate 2-sulfatase